MVSGFYYLQSRYYDPEVGRFINADSYTSTGQGYVGYNMFAYCGNNPVSREDSDGNSWSAVGCAILCQYMADILTNIADGATGFEVLMPVSTLTEYCTAAITAVIPGDTFVHAIARSAISESITWVDNILTGNSEANDIGKSLTNVMLNSAIDYGVGQFLNQVENALGLKTNTDRYVQASAGGRSGAISRLNQTSRAMLASEITEKAISRIVDITVCLLT